MSWPQPVRHRGVIMIITLLALVLLAALVMFVVNLGQQTNRRVVAQQSADAAAAAGAGWMARSFNTVATNNVAISRYLALVNTLDAMPQSVEATRLEQQTFRDVLRGSVNVGTGSSQLDNITSREFAKMLARLNEEVDLITPPDDLFHSYDVSQMTHYNAGPGHLGRAMTSLDQFNQAVMENVGTLAQLNAVRGGEVNMDRRDGVSAAMMVPVVPRVPWARGRFIDFKNPVRLGLLPDDADDTLIRRGPYDTVFGWRHYRSRCIDPAPRSSLDTTSASTAASATPVAPLAAALNAAALGADPFGGPATNPRPNSGRGCRQWERKSYRTFGTFEWTVDRVIDWAYYRGRPNLRLSRFGMWFNALSNTKLHYGPLGDGDATPKYFAMPHWHTDYPADLPAMANEILPFSETGYIDLEIQSRFPLLGGGGSGGGGGTFMGANDSWAFNHNPYDDGLYAQKHIKRGWWLPPNRLTGMNTRDIDELATQYPDLEARKVGANAWVLQSKHPWRPNLRVAIPEGDPVYIVRVMVYVGVNRNLDPGSRPILLTPQPGQDGDDDPPITNPYDGFDASSEEAPAPTDFDHALISPQPDARRQYLTYLAAARTDDRPQMWPSRFTGHKPDSVDGGPGNIVAIAQAQVFNNHSWDLWTQMWYSQLEPVDDFGGWVTRMEDSAGDVGLVPAVQPQAYDELAEYFRAIEPLADVMATH